MDHRDDVPELRQHLVTSAWDEAQQKYVTEENIYGLEEDGSAKAEAVETHRLVSGKDGVCNAKKRAHKKKTNPPRLNVEPVTKLPAPDVKPPEPANKPVDGDKPAHTCAAAR